jgi:hypothetical protein
MGLLHPHEACCSLLDWQQTAALQLVLLLGSLVVLS